jgi:hypothetical protein
LDQRDKKRKKISLAKRKEQEELRRRRKSGKSMELRRMNRLYKNSGYKQLGFKNLHPGLRRRFFSKCILEGATSVGKLRYFMWATLNGKIDQEKLEKSLENELLENLPIEDDRSFPRNLSINRIPYKLHDEFKRWCKLRGYTISGRLKDMIVAYIKGAIE